MGCGCDFHRLVAWFRPCLTRVEGHWRCTAHAVFLTRYERRVLRRNPNVPDAGKSLGALPWRDTNPAIDHGDPPVVSWPPPFGCQYSSARMGMWIYFQL
jgi:hypothetical protein